MTGDGVDGPIPGGITVKGIQRVLALIAASPWSVEPEIVSPAEYQRRAADPLWTGETSA
jgi:hypothetical protein